MNLKFVRPISSTIMDRARILINDSTAKSKIFNEQLLKVKKSWLRFKKIRGKDEFGQQHKQQNIATDSSITLN